MIIPRNYLFRIHPLFSHSLSPYPPPSHSSAPFSFNFPPFVRYPISSQYPQSYSISMQMADNGACVSPFDPCPVIIQYVRVTRDVITGFCRSSLSHCWRFTIELENRGNRRSTCTMYTHVFSFILFFFYLKCDYKKYIALWFFFKLEVLNFLATRGVLVLIMILGLKVHGIVRGRECMESFYSEYNKYGY